ncbi:unnamed protein product [Effrenium voratum]|nr:unnamed protein product [Effrenium voratum]
MPVSWWQQIAFFRSSWRCISYDIRGYGRTPNPTGDSMGHLISDLEALVQHLGLSTCCLVAQSMGGRAALGFATRHPQKVRALVMADNWGNFDWPEQVARAKEFSIPAGHPGGVGRRFAQEQPSLHFLWQSLKGLNPPRPPLAGCTPGGPTLDQVRQLPVPVLCIVGEDDVIFHPPLIRAFAELLPSSEYVEVEGAGHSVYFEKADTFNKLIQDFLQRAAES